MFYESNNLFKFEVEILYKVHQYQLIKEDNQIHKYKLIKKNEIKASQFNKECLILV